MQLTKETMIHIAVITAVTGSVFAVILSSGAVNLDELKIHASARAELVNDILFLKYVIYNTGDYNVQNVTVTARCCDHIITHNNLDTSIPLLNLITSEDYYDIISITNAMDLSTGDDIVVQFDAYDTSGNHDVYTSTVTVQ